MNDQLLSLLSGEQIKQESLVKSAEEGLYRASTYDLSIGQIIPSGGITFDGPKFLLPSGGMVRVISKEGLCLPTTVTGHVLLKNKLCTQGVLALSIGVVDPGFEGPISSTLINFGRETCEIKRGDAFLRVSFFRCMQSEKAKSEKHTREGYVQQVRQDVLAYSAPTFLNMDVMTTKAAKKAFKSFQKSVLWWATIFGFLIAFLAIFAPLGASFVDKSITAHEQDQTQMEIRIQSEVEARYDSRLKALSDQINELNQRTGATGKANAVKNRQ